MTALAAQLFQTRGRALRGFRPRRSPARLPRSARIASYPPSSGSAFWPVSLPSSSSSSKGSHSCSGSVYGPSSQEGLGGCGAGFLATSRSVGQPLAYCAFNCSASPLGIVYAERGAVAVAEIEFGQIAVQVPLVAPLVDPD